MDLKMNILEPNEIRDNLITCFKNQTLIPIVGAGFSCGSIAYSGTVPTGSEYKQHMINVLNKNTGFTPEEMNSFKNESFSTLCDYYEDNDNVLPSVRFDYLKSNFYKVDMQDDIRTLFFNIDWPYIYSLNIDDAIENTSQYKRIIVPNREFNDEIFNDEKCLIKLHGDIGEIVTYKKGEKIFTSKEYALSLDRNTPLLNKLRNDYKNQNIIFIGCSLDDEIDLKTLSTWPFDYTDKDTLSRTIIFIKGKPSKLQQSKFKTYGITDIVCFQTFDEMYHFLLDTWKESTQIQGDELTKHNQFSMSFLKGTEIGKNQDYFLWGKGLLDLKKQIITYPYYFISRNIKETIIKNISKNKVHLIYGSRLSGKSYLLADLYENIRDREVFYFDGKSRITQTALEKLIEKRGIVSLFDIGTIGREQFEYILQNAQKINICHSNFIINVNYNDSDKLGIVKWKLKQNIIQSTDILTYSLDNKFINNKKAKELKEINKLLPTVHLPPCTSKRTLLDQLIYAENLLKKKGKFSTQHIKIQTPKQLALLIVLAIKEKIFSLEIVNFSFDLEIAEALKRYDPFVERIEVNIHEKDASDLSRTKYVLNSKYWLRRELGDYARKKENYKIVGDAYRYIINKVIDFCGHNEYKQRKICRSFILFDVMNDIFLDEFHGNIELIVYVYTVLHELLAKDFHFLHQNAKCYLNYSYFIANNCDKLDYLNNALELVKISKAMIENKYEEKNNERLLITLAHTQYTLATILCEICRINNYLKIEENDSAINEINEAIYSPYNSDDYQRERKKKTLQGINSFMQNAITNYTELNISSESRNKLDELINIFLLDS